MTRLANTRPKQASFARCPAGNRKPPPAALRRGLPDRRKRPQGGAAPSLALSLVSERASVRHGACVVGAPRLARTFALFGSALEPRIGHRLPTRLYVWCGGLFRHSNASRMKAAILV